MNMMFKAVQTFKHYFKNIQKIEPNILILDSNFNDTKYTELIDKVTALPNEKKINVI